MNISVVIPSYNRGEKLRETIESVEKNDFKGTFEILIINDKSTDNTREAITSLIEKFGNIRTLENPRNLGPAGSRNNGIKIAHGELIFFTDDDCVVPQNWLSFYFNFFKEHKEVYSAGGALEPKEKNLISFIESLKDRMLGIKQSQMKIGNEEVKTGFTNNCVYRKEVFASEGYFEENFKVPAGEDFEFNQRVARRYKVAFVPISVLHNHKYNWDYLFGILYKQGLGEMPPKNYKLIRLILKTPRLLWNIVRKLNGYRSAPTGGAK